MDIAELNRRVIIKSWGTTKDEAGGSSVALIAQHTLWAKVEDRNGRQFTNADQTVWSYDYKITIRYEKTRIVTSNMTVDYDGKRLTINSISYEKEAKRAYCILRCSTSDAVISSDDEFGLQTYNYYGIGEETAWDDSLLINKTIIGAFKDGIEFEVYLDPDHTLTLKQVYYNSETGEFTWSAHYQVNEHTLIQYI